MIFERHRARHSEAEMRLGDLLDQRWCAARSALTESPCCAQEQHRPRHLGLREAGQRLTIPEVSSRLVRSPDARCSRAGDLGELGHRTTQDRRDPCPMPQRDDRHDLHCGCRRRPQKTKINIIDAADSRRGEDLAHLRQPATSEALTQPVRTANYPRSAALAPHLGECGRRRTTRRSPDHPAPLLTRLCEQADPTGVEEDHRRPAFRRGVRHPGASWPSALPPKSSSGCRTALRDCSLMRQPAAAPRAP